ncbi:MAG: DUF6790 family protein [Campylobacterales bacterium]
MRSSKTIAFFHILLIIAPPVVALLDMTADMSFKQRLDTLLLYYLVIGVGFQGVMAGFKQITKGEETAAYLNWPYSPFVKELGYMNLSFGVLGISCYFITGTFWEAVGIGYSIFLLLAAYNHIMDAVENHNFSLGNLGPTLWSDVLIPGAIIGLIVLRNTF